MMNHKFEITTKQKQQVSHQGAEKFQTKQGFSGWGNAAGNGENRSAPSCQTLSHNSEIFWTHGPCDNSKRGKTFQPKFKKTQGISATSKFSFDKEPQGDTFYWIRLNPITMSHRSESSCCQLSGVENRIFGEIAKTPPLLVGIGRSHRSRLLGWEMDKMDFSYRTPFLLELLLGSCIMNVFAAFCCLHQNISRKNRNQNICSKPFEVSGPKPSHKKSSTNQGRTISIHPHDLVVEARPKGPWRRFRRGKNEKKMCKMECCWIILLNNSLMYQTSSFFCSIEFLSIADFRVGYPPLLGGSKQRSLCSGRLGIIPKASIFRCMFYLSGDGRTFQSNLVQNHPIKKLDLIYCLWKFAPILFSRGISVVPTSCHVH